MKIAIDSGTVVRRFGPKEGLRMLAEAGFTGVDLGLTKSWNFEELITAPTLSGLCVFEEPMDRILAYYAPQLKAIQENGLTIVQTHAPYRAYDFRRPEILDYVIRIYDAVVRFCGVIGCPMTIIHGISIREDDNVTTPDECDALNRKLFAGLIPALTDTPSVTVCMENLFTRAGKYNFVSGTCADPHEAAALIDEMNEKAGRKAFALCLDSGHLHLLRTDPRYYTRILRDRIVTLHLHDNDQMNDSHLIPFVGSLRWDLFLDALAEIGYNGNIVFESGCGQLTEKRLPDELVPTFLSATCEVGRYFASKIERIIETD